MSLLTKIKTWLNHTPTPSNTPHIDPETILPAENTHIPQEESNTSPTPTISHETQPEPTDVSELPPIDTITLHKNTEFCGLMLEKVLLTHRTWLQNLESALRGENPSIYKTKLASDDRLAELGMWLYKNESIFAPYPEYAILLEINKRFHECAGEVVEHHRCGRFADAILLLRRDLLLLSDEVQKSLINLHQQVQKSGEKICE